MAPVNGRFRVRLRQALAALAALTVLAACGSSGMSASGHAGMPAMGQQRAAEANPDLDPGSSLGGTAAPDFRLTNQFGQQVSLSAFRGKVVVLAFTDSECTTICPLTTVSMLEAKQLLGRAGQDVQLLGVDANPDATAVSDVMAYSRSHAMVNQWDFLTGPPSQLRAVWKAYNIYVQIQSGQVDHTPALFVINQRGQEEEVYLTTMAYARVGQSPSAPASRAWSCSSPPG
jgi:cytochrome oxidase Cu insertion factor (SCO1/SenC/PrrC family)